MRAYTRALVGEDRTLSGEIAAAQDRAVLEGVTFRGQVLRRCANTLAQLTGRSSSSGRYLVDLGPRRKEHAGPLTSPS
jgi:hypothetical protein